MARTRKVKVSVRQEENPAQPSEAVLKEWSNRISDWEERVIEDARLLGEIPIADYVDRPFQVPPDVEAELRRRRNPAYLEGLRAKAHDARREAEHRRALAGMLREKGDAEGAASQDRAAEEYDRQATDAAFAAATAAR